MTAGPWLGTTWRRVAAALAGRAPTSPDPEYRAWLALRTPVPEELARQRSDALALSWRPLFDVLVLRREGDAEDFERTAGALRAQTWPLLRVHPLRAGEDLAGAVGRLRGDLVVALEAGDLLAPHALHAWASAADPEVDVLYADEDRWGERGREHPYFKSRWSPEELRSHAYLGVAAFRRGLAAADARILAGGAAGHAAQMALSPALRRVVHVPDVLVHRSARAHGTRAPRAPEAAPGPLPPRPARVTAVIPTRDQAPLLATCVASLDRLPNQAELELLVVDDRSTAEDARALLRRLAERPRTRVLRWAQPFNWSSVNDLAARHATGEYLLFLNNDVEAMHAGWLDALVAVASRPEIGLVGAQLLYPDGTLQHYGVVLGMTGFAGHLLQGCPPDVIARCGPADVVRNCAAVTGACLLVRREVFDRLGGFDERFVLCGSDVALGLSAMAAGLRNVVTPHARLVHYESRTRGATVPPSDFAVSYEVYEPWLRAGDPYYNPNLSLRDTHARIRLAREDMLAVARRYVP